MATALVIEDDDDIRRLLRGGAHAGRILRCRDGHREGWARGDRGTGTDLLLVDVGLPDIEGYEVVRRARDRVGGHIVMLSARSQEADIQLGIDAGAGWSTSPSPSGPGSCASG